MFDNELLNSIKLLLNYSFAANQTLTGRGQVFFEGFP